ncbi:phage minor capsid protein [Galactobacter sp.]|uniref:phage minor capsid protein n=1 Tax=Galactobacter sp. TaxID=2676125 RepID=UPI0025C08642|nr:phage minor capsid protein [Galactobacter sp.]
MKWTPPPTTPLDEVLEQITRDLVAVFALAEEDVLKAVALEAKAGLFPDELTPAELGRLRRHVQDIADRVATASPELIQQIVDKAAEAGMGVALTQLGALPGLPGPFRRVGHAQAVMDVIGDLTNSMDDVTRRLLRFPDDLYRRAIAQSTTRNLLVGTGQQPAQAAAWRALVRDGVTGFTDKAGRRWNLATYTEMASRTATIRAYRAQNEHTMQANGINMVRVVGGNDMCHLCGPWANRTLSLDGTPAGDYPMLSAVEDRMVTMHVAGTIDQARDQGWGHPNCRCTTVCVLPGVEPAIQGPTYSPDMEQERDRLRALERRVRRLKREDLLDNDPTIRKRIAQTQEQIREHVEATGLKRQRRREQLNLGHQRR